MMISSRLRPAVLSLATAVTLGVLTAGCGGSVSVGGGSIAKADVQQGVKDALAKQVGKAPDSVTCPSDLQATVGASERCTLTADGTTLGLTVTVSSLDPSTNTANYSVVVDGASGSPAPAGTPAATPSS